MPKLTKNHFVRFFAIIGMATMSSEPSSAQDRWQVPDYRVFGQPGSESDKQAIDQLVERFRDAWYHQRTDDVLATHAHDIEWINAYARIFRGVEPLRVFLDERLFPAFDRAASEGEASNLKPISRRYIGKDAALLHWYTDGNRGASRNAGDGARRTHMHFVLGKQDGAWKIVHLAIFDARR